MKNEKDLRVIKTKKRIAECFLVLLERKSLEQITVTELCKMAECSRNTFYFHFPYKEALYDYVLDMFIDMVKSSLATADRLPTENIDEFAVRYMYNAGDLLFTQKELLRPILVREHATVFFNKLTSALRESIMDKTKIHYPEAPHNDQYRLMCWYSSSAIVGFLMGCIYDVDISKEKALEILCAMHAPSFQLGIRLLQNG